MGLQGPSWGTIRLSDAYNTSLSPAPVTPTTGSGPYELLSGTIRSTLETHLRKDGLPMTAVVSPGLMTDTRYYWNLTKHIFRYGHQGAADAYNGIHTINEGQRVPTCPGLDYSTTCSYSSRGVLGADSVLYEAYSQR
ncbi:hypothetical protein JVT61DRAFT_4094 [Boletus reticuloceps]|uniref:Uncharacterized protein n=1 Tax=Boletus reticuloceps TaxID=495285 RepID=A0A8I3A7I9_9AGAM|nr:hypothetical protein JVT61DRAFT_4094 [Boletus reticuloceps]